MFTQHELELIHMVVGNRATEVRRFVEQNEYSKVEVKVEDERYAGDLEALVAKVARLLK